MNKKWLRIIAGTAAIAVIALTLTAVLPATASAHGGGWGRFGQRDPVPGTGQTDYLAEALGITSAELQAAYQKANEAAIDQALEQGLITQAQADWLKARGLPFGKMGRFGFFGGTIDMDSLLADALGISVDELQAAQQAARDAALQDAVDAGRITQEQADQIKARQALRDYLQEQGFQDSIRSLYEDAVQKAVEAGVITQEQADQILSDVGPGFGGPCLKGFGGPGRHDGFGMRGFHGHGGFAPSRLPGNTSSSSSL
ncbi:MAG: hypothetical protein D6775_05695 [Caldilineae bacterium]|nr:MAG: hypothetical protein D6775_05695 [Caldilineae bacterium]